MDLVQQYDKLTQNLRHNPNDIASLCDLIMLYPQAKNTFDYEIANSIELFLDEVGHNQASVDFLIKEINQSQNQQEKNDFSELLEGLFAIKTHILTELKNYQNYADIEKFFDFIIALKTNKNVELNFLINLLTQLAGEIQDNLANTILTDTLDYMTGWYSLNSIVTNSPVANFIENLKKSINEKC